MVEPSVELMRIAVVQHEPFEGPGAIAEWAAGRGATVATTHVYAGEPLPPPDAYDLLVLMGGGMSVNDEQMLPWLAPEIAYVRNGLAAGKAMLGVCLGGQLIAKAAGARVGPAAAKEIGWMEVVRVGDAPEPWRDLLPERFTAFHWHGEAFDLPAGAARLAATATTPNQAFALGDRVLALQFHIEATPATVADLAAACAGDITPGPLQQSPAAIAAGAARHAPAMHAILFPLLDTLTRRA